MNPKARAERRDTRVLSEPVRLAAEARAVRSPLVVTGISAGVLRMITPNMFADLDVDAEYQRGETSMVDEIVRVLQAGGVVLDPVTLCRRPWTTKPNKLWIVDGHQRVCAFQQLGMSFQAIIHDSDDLASEKKFFLALNNRRAIVSDVIVRSWTGPSAVAIVKADKNPSHSLYGRVSTSQGTNNARIGATSIARGMLAASTGLEPTGSAVKVLGRADTAMKEAHRSHMAEQYLTLLGDCFPKGDVKSLVVVGLGKICWEHWSNGKDYPTKHQILAIRETNWDNVVPAWAKKFESKVLDTMRKLWP